MTGVALMHKTEPSTARDVAPGRAMARLAPDGRQGWSDLLRPEPHPLVEGHGMALEALWIAVVPARLQVNQGSRVSRLRPHFIGLRMARLTRPASSRSPPRPPPSGRRRRAPPGAQGPGPERRTPTTGSDRPARAPGSLRRRGSRRRGGGRRPDPAARIRPGEGPRRGHPRPPRLPRTLTGRSPPGTPPFPPAARSLTLRP